MLGTGALLLCEFAFITHEEVGDSPTPIALPDVLIFEEVTRQNIHLGQSHIGLFTAEREIIFGRYEMNDDTIDLVLNNFKRERLDLTHIQTFWKLFALYQHVHSMKS